MNAAATIGEKRPLRKTLFLVGTWSLSFVCLAWVLHDINFDSLSDNVQNMHWGWVAVAMIADMLVYCFQGWRWSLVLKPLGEGPGLAVHPGHLRRAVRQRSPASAGRARSSAVTCRAGGANCRSASSSLRQLIERIFDGVWLVTCLMVAVRLVPLPRYLIEGGTTLAIFVLTAAALLGAAMFWKESTHAALSGSRIGARSPS